MTMLELVEAYGAAKLNAGLTSGSEPTYGHEVDDLLDEIKQRIRSLRDARYTETGVAIADILDGHL